MDNISTRNRELIDLAIHYGGTLRFQYPKHGVGAPVERIVRPTEWYANNDGVMCETAYGFRGFLLDRIVGSVGAKLDA